MQIPNSGRNLLGAHIASSGGLILSDRDRKKESGRRANSVRAPIRAIAAPGIGVSSDGLTLSDRVRRKESGRKRGSVRAPIRATAAPGIVASSGDLTLSDRVRRKESGRKRDLPLVAIRLTAARGILVSSGGKIVQGLAADHLSLVQRQILKNPLQGRSLALDVPWVRAESFADADDLNPVVDPIREN
jgi:hypothetical protein